MKKQHIALIIIFSIASFVIGHVTNCDAGKKGRQPVAVEYFKQGDTLPPDMVCPYTRIVTDAVGLNKAFGFEEQNITWGSDSDIDSLFHCYTKTID